MTAQLVYVTTGSLEEARRIGRALVEERLAAAVNIITGVTSIYRWHGAIHEAHEVVVVAKTRRERLGALTARVREMHAYECPGVVAIPVAGGSEPYLRWIAAETG